MKTMKNILTLATLFTMLTGYAVELNPTVPSSKVTTITFDNVKKGQDLRITDSEATVLYQEQIKTNGTYAKYFDLTSLKNGNYSIELVVKEDLLLVSQLCTIDEALDIEIYFNDQLIKKETISNSKQLGRIYQLSKEYHGSYAVIMKSSGKTFYKVFEL